MLFDNFIGFLLNKKTKSVRIDVELLRAVYFDAEYNIFG